jgi:hypothetical protein
MYNQNIYQGSKEVIIPANLVDTQPSTALAHHNNLVLFVCLFVCLSVCLSCDTHHIYHELLLVLWYFARVSTVLV